MALKICSSICAQEVYANFRDGRNYFLSFDVINVVAAVIILGVVASIFWANLKLCL
jgi:hypothetical protein